MWRGDNDVTQFSFSREELVSLSDAHHELQDRCDSFDYVVTFARGGIPALNFITRLHFDRHASADNSEAIEKLRCKYHVFPALGPIASERLLTEWLDTIEKPGSILLFDTGSKGNGARRILKAIKRYIAARSSPNIERVQIVGLVDGCCKHQVPKCELVPAGLGRTVPVEIEYRRVACVLTEDCPTLLGYDTLRSLGLVKPIFTNALLRLSDESKETYIVIGARSAGVVLSEFLRNPGSLEPTVDPEATNLHMDFVKLMILDQTFERESKELRGAAQLGLIGRSAYRTNLRALTREYRTKEILPPKEGKIRRTKRR